MRSPKIIVVMIAARDVFIEVRVVGVYTKIRAGDDVWGARVGIKVKNCIIMHTKRDVFGETAL